MPDDYIRKQTLVNGERYITPELKEYETRVLNSQSLLEKLEAELLGRVRGQVASTFPGLKKSSIALASVDVLLSFAEVAESCHLVAPSVDDGLILSVREGRHPVVEGAIGRGAFVPNDCVIDPNEQQILMLTGPNMAGKSTYMRQVALITILAQMGSFVPASEARIGLVDRVFTRIGASDSLSRGESTFMIEMKETAAILEHATERSLILLDEVGRGTSTFDGISIAWAVAESLHERAERPRTLFATHYHELTDLARTKERIKNYNFAVKEWQGDIIFLRNVVEGAASRSYGIHVARLAGLPAPVIDHAKAILARLEGGGDECRGRLASAWDTAIGDQPIADGVIYRRRGSVSRTTAKYRSYQRSLRSKRSISFLSSPKMLKNDSDRTRYLMTKMKLPLHRYCPRCSRFACDVFGSFQFFCRGSEQQRNPRVSPGKSSTAECRRLRTPQARPRNRSPSRSFRRAADGQELSEFGALYLHVAVYSRAARLIERS